MDDKKVSQADFDRITGATRDDWRKWTRRGLVSKPRGPYAWRHVLEALVLVRFEELAGLDVVVRCWDDVHEDLLAQIRSKVLDVVVDPGTSRASRPKLRAYLSTDDGETARIARTAEHPIVIDLARAVSDARDEFERVGARVREHADAGNPRRLASRRSAGTWS